MIQSDKIQSDKILVRIGERFKQNAKNQAQDHEDYRGHLDYFILRSFNIFV